MEHLKRYWEAEKLPADRLALLLAKLAEEHKLLIPDPPREPAKDLVDGFEPKMIEVEDWKCLKHTSIDLGKKLAFLCGRNATGKSSLMQAMQFALTGAVPNVELKQLPAYGAKEGAVELELSNGHVSRSIVDGKAKVMAELGDEKTNAVKKAEALIEQHVGNGKLLAGLTLIHQESMSVLLDEQPGVRQAAFYRVVGLDGYEAVRAALSKVLQVNEAGKATSRAGIDAEIALVRKQQAELPKITTSLDELQEKKAFLLELKAKVAKWENEMSSLRAEEKTVVESGKNTSSLPDCCPTCGEMGVICHLPPQAKQAKVDQLRARWFAIQTELEAAAKDVASLRVDVTREEAEIRAIEELYTRHNYLEGQVAALGRAATPNDPASQEALLDLAALVQTFSRTGYPLFAVSSAIAAVNQIADGFQQGDRFIWRFTPELGIVAQDGKEEVQPRLMSGAARQRGALALRVAMNIYEGMLRGMRTKFLWVDEFPYQDAENEVIALELFKRISDRVGHLLVNISRDAKWYQSKDAEVMTIG